MTLHDHVLGITSFLFFAISRHDWPWLPGFATHLDLDALLHSALAQDAAPRSTHGHFGRSGPARRNGEPAKKNT